jgi:hypothetical protein
MRKPTTDLKNYWHSHDDYGRDYIPYRHCLSYIKQKSVSIPYSGKMKEERLRIMTGVGMVNFDKFQRRRLKFDKLEGNIPLDYFHEIGVEVDVLNFCLGLDIDDYEKVLSRERKVTHCFAKMVGGFFSTIPLPSDCTDEAHAIEFLHNEMLNSNLHYPMVTISYNHIICHTFKRAEGFVKTQYYYPSLVIKNNIMIKQTSDKIRGLLWV